MTVCFYDSVLIWQCYMMEFIKTRPMTQNWSNTRYIFYRTSWIKNKRSYISLFSSIRSSLIILMSPDVLVRLYFNISRKHIKDKKLHLALWVRCIARSVLPPGSSNQKKIRWLQQNFHNKWYNSLTPSTPKSVSLYKSCLPEVGWQQVSIEHQVMLSFWSKGPKWLKK